MIMHLKLLKYKGGIQITNLKCRYLYGWLAKYTKIGSH